MINITAIGKHANYSERFGDENRELKTKISKISVKFQQFLGGPRNAAPDVVASSGSSRPSAGAQTH